MKHFKKVMSLLLVCLIAVMSAVMANAEDKTELKFREDGTFRILQLTDTQDDRYPAYDMLNLVELAIKEAQPDLIVFTGDLVEDSRIGDIFTDDQSFKEGVVVKKGGNVDHEKTLENLTAAADAVLDIFQKSGVPFIIAQGNNDHKCDVSNAEWLEIYKKYSNCLLEDKSGDDDGAIDCNVEIKNKDGETVFNIWAMDTMRGGVSAQQIEWYKTASDNLKAANGGEPVPSLLFQHIQVPDVGNLFEECNIWDEGSRLKSGRVYRLNRDIAHGYNWFTYTPCEPSEQFKAWKEQGDVIGAFFGHQHFDGFSGIVDGIELGFTYGSEMAKHGPYGYRLITLYEDDILNYDNELYTYEGSVKPGNAHFEKQIDEHEYKTYSNSFEKFFFGIVNVFKMLIYSFLSIFG